jgi:4'-phosphopantetheinyl transferase EntD
MFGEGVLTAVSRIDGDVNDLPVRERACVAQACVSRQREFATGRLLARSLLARIGLADAEVLVGDDRSPIWPPNIVGSISHAGGLCVVALSPRDEILGLGVDLEYNQPLEQELVETICTARERTWLARYGRTTRGLLARLIFSAKESAFKCQYPLTKTHLEYDDVDIELDVRYERFTARIRRGIDWTASRNAVLYGRFCVSPSWIASGVSLRRSVPLPN